MRLLIPFLICLFLLSAAPVAAGGDSEGSCSGDDYEATLETFTRQAEAGDPSAQFLLGLMYAEGKGVPRDLTSAYFWLSMSIQLGNEDALDLLSELAGNMTNDQIVAASNYDKK